MARGKCRRPTTTPLAGHPHPLPGHYTVMFSIIRHAGRKITMLVREK